MTFHHRPRMSLILLLTACAGLCGCGGSRPAEPAPAPAAAAANAPPVVSPSAFDLGPVGAPPVFGDNIAMEVVMEKAGTRTVRRLLVFGYGEDAAGRFRSTSTLDGEIEPLVIECGLFGTYLRVMDERNSEVSMSNGGVPMFVFGNSLFHACEVIDRVNTASGLTYASTPEDFARAATHEERFEIARGYLSLYAMSLSLQTNKVFNKMLFEAVEKPSLLSLLIDPLRLSILVRPGESPRKRWHVIGDVALPAYLMPMKLQLNGTDAMLLDLTVVDQHAPLGLCGGAVAIDARHPTKPDVKVTVRLIGAHQGKGLPLDQANPVEPQDKPTPDHR